MIEEANNNKGAPSQFEKQWAKVTDKQLNALVSYKLQLQRLAKCDEKAVGTGKTKAV